MSRLRVGVVYVLLVAILGGHLVMIAFRGEQWPFSRYPMYSGLRRDTAYAQAKLFGVRADTPGDVEVEFRPGFLPLSDLVVRTGIERQLDGNDRARLERMLKDTLDWYEQRRAAGRHDGPSLRGIRVYELKWEGDPRRRASTDPHSKELRCELLEPA